MPHKAGNKRAPVKAGRGAQKPKAPVAARGILVTRRVPARPAVSQKAATGKSNPPMMTITFDGKRLERACYRVVVCCCRKCWKTYPEWVRKFWKYGEI